MLLQRAVRELIGDELSAQHAAMPHLVAKPDARLPIRFNESVVFVRGGPMNDNGQTGRKLVCDFYGPRLPHGATMDGARHDHETVACYPANGVERAGGAPPGTPVKFNHAHA